MSCSVRQWTLGIVAATVLAVGLAPTTAEAQATRRQQPAQTSDGYRDAHRLGGSTSFYRPSVSRPLTTPASLKRMMGNKQVVADIRNVLQQGGVDPNVAETIVTTLTNPTEIVRGIDCNEATPVDGVLVDCAFQPGETLEWMAYKPRVKGKPTPSLIHKFRWAGRKPFQAWLFRVTTGDRIDTFVLPKPCGNLSLMKTEQVRKTPVTVTADRNCTPEGRLTVNFRASSEDLNKVGRIRVSLNGTQVGEMTSPSWSYSSDRPGTYTFEATDKDGKPYPVGTSSLLVEACPVPKPQITSVKPNCEVSATATKVSGGYEIAIDATRSAIAGSNVAPRVSVEIYDPAGAMVGQRLTLDNSLMGRLTVKKRGAYRVRAVVTMPEAATVGTNRYEGETTCETSVQVGPPEGEVAGIRFFADGTFGKERRVRPLDDGDGGVVTPGTALEYGQCSPLVGLKFGVLKPLRNGWEVGGALGAALNVTTDDNKTNEHALFIDAEVNKHFDNRMFLGTGLSLWDLTRSDTFTPAWLVHFGVPLNQDGAKVPVYFIGEGRLFFDNIDDVDNNYQFWGGIRLVFPTDR